MLPLSAAHQTNRATSSRGGPRRRQTPAGAIGDIATTSGPCLDSAILKSLANGLSNVDQFILSFIEPELKEAVENFGSGPFKGINLSADKPLIVRNALQEIYDAQLGRKDFSENYLRSTALLEFWRFAFELDSIVWEMYSEQVEEAPERAQEIRGTLTERALMLEKEVKPLSELILAAAEGGLLNEDRRSAIGSRWVILDKIVDRYHHRNHTERTSPKWLDMAARLSRVEVRPEMRPPTLIFEPEKEVASSDWTSTCMWLTFIASIIVTLPTCAIAVRSSPHTSGTAQDADFWFLMQGSSMQFLGFLTTGIPMWRGKELSGHSWYWTWGFIGLAIGCTIAAPISYCKVPTEWSSLLSIIAGIVHAFVVLQIAIMADSKGRSGERKGLKNE